MKITLLLFLGLCLAGCAKKPVKAAAPVPVEMFTISSGTTPETFTMPGDFTVHDVHTPEPGDCMVIELLGKDAPKWHWEHPCGTRVIEIPPNTAPGFTSMGK
jgi:hypothetical protein